MMPEQQSFHEAESSLGILQKAFLRQRRVSRSVWFGLAAWMCLLCPLTAEAAPGVRMLLERGTHDRGLYERMEEDMRVKARTGTGYVRVVRLWTGGEWKWDARWGNMRLHGVPPEADGEEGAPAHAAYWVELGGVAYAWEKEARHAEHLEEAERVYRDGSRRWVRHEGKGVYVWGNRAGSRAGYRMVEEPEGEEKTGSWKTREARLEWYANRNGNRVDLERDSQGRVSRLLSGEKELLRYRYDREGRMEAVEGRGGRTVRYRYDGEGRLSVVLDVRGQGWRYAYDAEGRLASVTDPMGYRQELEYDGESWTGMKDTDGGGYKLETEHDADRDRYVRRVTDGTGLVTEWETDASGSLARLTVGGELVREVTTLYSDGSSDARSADMRKEAETGLREARGLSVLASVTRSQGSSARQVPAAKRRARVTLRSRRVREADGRETRYEYDGRRDLVRVVHPDSGVAEMSYHAEYGFPVRVKADTGVVTEYAYDAEGNLTELRQGAGLEEERTLTHGYDAHGQLTELSVSGKDGEALEMMRFTYDEWGNVLTRTDGEGNTHRYAGHDALGNPGTYTDPLGRVWKWTYDAAGNPLRLESPAGRVGKSEYDGAGRLRTSEGAAGGVVALRYAEGGSRLRGMVSGLSRADVESGIPEAGEAGDEISFQYDAAGRLLGVRDATGRGYRLSYDGMGRLSSETDGEGNRVEYRYRDWRLAGMTYPTYEEDYGYDRRGDVSSVTVSGADMMPRQRRWKRDRDEWTATYTDALGNVTESRADGLGRMTEVEDALGGVTRFKWDAADRLQEIEDAEGGKTRFSYDRAGRLVSETDTGGRVTAYTYDASGSVTAILAPGGERTELVWSAGGDLSEVRHYMEGESKAQRDIRFQYDKAGRLSSWKEGKRGESYKWDIQGRLVEVTVDFGEFGKTWGCSYDGAGRREACKNPEGLEYGYEYDKAGRFAKMTIPGAEGALKVERRKWLAPEMVTWPGGMLEERRHDHTLRELGRSLRNAEGQELHRQGWEYDLEGNVTGWEDWQQQDGAWERGYRYDALHRLVGMDRKEGEGEDAKDVEERAWEYDALGNRVKDGKTEEDAWEYDAGHALTRVGAPTPEEPAGTSPPASRTPMGASAPQEPVGAGSTSAFQAPAGLGSASAPQESVGSGSAPAPQAPVGSGSAPASQEPVGAGPRARPGREGTSPTGAQSSQTATPPSRMSYGYDRNGSRTEEYREGKLWRRYAYGASGRLVRVEDADGGILAEYGYDPFGRRIWKKVGEETTYFLYTREGLSAEYDAQGTLIREYRWWPGAGWMREPVLQRAGGKLYWYRNDRLGRPWAMYDSDGTPRWLARQGPFGEKGDEWSKGVENLLRFPGQYHDEETGLHYNGHRYYDPETGGYLRRDPIGLAGGMNPYGYAGSSPLAAIDPLGLVWGLVIRVVVNVGKHVVRRVKGYIKNTPKKKVAAEAAAVSAPILIEGAKWLTYERHTLIFGIGNANVDCILKEVVNIERLCQKIAALSSDVNSPLYNDAELVLDVTTEGKKGLEKLEKIEDFSVEYGAAKNRFTKEMLRRLSIGEDIAGVILAHGSWGKGHKFTITQDDGKKILVGIEANSPSDFAKYLGNFYVAANEEHIFVLIEGSFLPWISDSDIGINFLIEYYLKIIEKCTKINEIMEE